MTMELADLARKIDLDVKRQALVQSAHQWLTQFSEGFLLNVTIGVGCSYAGAAAGYMQAMALIEEALKAELPEVIDRLMGQCPAELDEIRTRYEGLLVTEAAR